MNRDQRHAGNQPGKRKRGQAFLRAPLGLHPVAALLCLLLWALAGCMVGPNFEPPHMAMPSRWAGGAPSSAVPSDAAAQEELARWWRVFHDRTLSSLVEMTAQRNLDVKLAEARILEARALKRGAVAGFGPTLNATGFYQYGRWPAATRPSSPPNVLIPSSPGPVGPVSPDSEKKSPDTSVSGEYEVAFDAGWEIDFFGRVRRSVEAADADLQAAHEARRDVLVTLMAEIAREYVELRALQQRIRVARLNLGTQEKSVELTRQRHKAGFVSRLDVTIAEAQTATTASQIPLLESAARQTIYTLSVLLGQEPAALLPDLTPIEKIPFAVPSVPVGVPSELLRRRPDIRRAEAEIHAATARIGVAVADLFPKFTLIGSAGYKSYGIDSALSLSSVLWSVGPSVSWNLFNSGRTLAEIELQKALRDQSVIAYKQKVLSALKEVENALIALAKEEEHRQALSRAVEASRQSVELATVLYRNGETDFLNVLQAHQSLYASEDALILGTRAISVNLIALYKALGGGWDPENPREPPSTE